MTLTARKYYPFIDGLRTYACFWVLLHHMIHSFQLVVIQQGPFKFFLDRFFAIGFLGVDVFFVISGFLIMGLLMPDFEKGIRVKRFYIRRFLKIFPHYIFIVCLGLWIARSWHSPTGDVKDWLGYFVFIQNYSSDIPILGHLWSIAVEEHFYLFLPLVLQGVCFLQKDSAKRIQRVVFVLVGLILLGNGIRFIGFQFDLSKNDLIMYQMTHFRYDALLFGCLIKLFEERIYQIDDRLKKMISSRLLFIAFSIFLFFMIKFDNYSWYYYTLAYVAAGCMIVSGLMGNKFLSFMTCRKPLIWLGKNSYGIYLWHHILLFPAVIVSMESGISQIYLFYMLFSVLFGVLSTVTIERFFLNKRKILAP